jgi:hypothetical protein
MKETPKIFFRKNFVFLPELHWLFSTTLHYQQMFSGYNLSKNLPSHRRHKWVQNSVQREIKPKLSSSSLIELYFIAHWGTFCSICLFNFLCKCCFLLTTFVFSFHNNANQMWGVEELNETYEKASTCRSGSYLILSRRFGFVQWAHIIDFFYTCWGRDWKLLEWFGSVWFFAI